MEFDRMEIRPGMKSGLLLIGIGAVDVFTGAATRLATEWAGTYGMWAIKSLCVALIGLGIWHARRKIVVDNGGVVFSGLAKGKRKAEIRIMDIESAGYEPGGRILAFKAKESQLRIALARNSKAAEDLIAALKDRGVNISSD